MLWRGPEDGVLLLCKELGIGFVPWSPLGVGFLTSAIDERTRFAEGDIRGIEGRFSPESAEQLDPRRPCEDLCRAKKRDAWSDRAVMADGPEGIVPIPGSTQMPHMLENIGAASISFSFVRPGTNPFPRASSSVGAAFAGGAYETPLRSARRASYSWTLP
ncbi:aldo/keto reductase [Rhizobium tubonense]|uniref:NADP-dependent oxidoreductase domain-containing protein n=1 Tax=Rhizobium tubonense TaxID=484088 RepID=A0A2W4F207_9HYPH|nr:hypothetical protein CPY51_05370 [Rhizobium tubonense]